MIELELHIPAGATSEVVAKVIEQVSLGNGLVCALKDTLARYPGCIHWHYRKPREKGTLEVTWWEDENRLWFKVAKGRTAHWIEEVLPKLKKEMEIALR